MKSSIANGENRGSVNNILLKALQSGDKYGYEINKEIEVKSKGKFFLKEASLYSGLKRLEANGYITSYWQDGELGIRRHYYSITESGLEKLNSSNFTWDNSKEFISEMFKDTPLTKNVKQSLNSQENNISVNNNILNSPSISYNEKDNNKVALENKQTDNTEIKKNPFQIEVSPFQQSIFDLSLNSNNEKDTSIEITEKTIEKGEENTLKQEEKQLIQTEIFDNKSFETNVKNKETINNDLENIDKTNNENNNEQSVKENNKENSTFSQVSYQDIIKNYTNNGYSQSLLDSNEKIDISKYLNKDKENDNNIIIEKSVSNEAEKKYIIEKTNDNINKNDNSILKVDDIEFSKDKFDENTDEIKINFTEKIENATNATPLDKEQIINLNIIDKTENIKENSQENNQQKVDIKNIFGSLLVDEKTEENTLNEEEIKIEETNEEIEQTIEQPIVKKEIPRINVENDVNITLNTNRVKNNNISNYKQNETKVEPLPYNTSNTPSVKQYINNVHKKTLIMRATNVEEEVNLEGINIREYKKMNNKIIRNSNYVYKNKLNLFLTIILSVLVILESLISFIVFNNAKNLGVFEILLLSTLIILSLIFIYYQAIIFVKDKFKVELKNFNFKNTLYYTILIFIVISIIFVCINIFQGMNTNNINDFIVKIVLELILSVNVILYPILKLWFYNFKTFTN